MNAFTDTSDAALAVLVTGGFAADAETPAHPRLRHDLRGRNHVKGCTGPGRGRSTMRRLFAATLAAMLPVAAHAALDWRGYEGPDWQGLHWGMSIADAEKAFRLPHGNVRKGALYHDELAFVPRRAGLRPVRYGEHCL